MPTRPVPLEQPPRRVVSLVPSLTESLFALGLEAGLVGVSDYCIYPAAQVARIPKVGGTKTARAEDILALQPDLVLANQEENAQETIEALKDRGVPVWLTFPWTVEELLADLRSLAQLYRSELALVRVNLLERSCEYARLAALEQTPRRYACLIWQESAHQPAWWMTFNRETYSHDLLALLGGENVFAQRERRYPLAADLGQAPAEPPGKRDTRYPRVPLDEIRAAQPEVILLPNEPYAFSPADVDRLQNWLAPTRVVPIDGSLITWPGTRLGQALNELGNIFG